MAQESENQSQQLSLQLGHVKEKVSAEEEKKRIFQNTEQGIHDQGTDKSLDKRREKRFILDYREHNPIRKYVRLAPKPYQVTIYMAFYEEICRLKGWPISYAKRRPGIVARYTIHLLYLRFPKEIIIKLQKENPYIGKSRLVKHFQLLTDIGEMELKVFLGEAISTMKESTIWSQFMRFFSKKNGLPYQTDLFLD